MLTKYVRRSWRLTIALSIGSLVIAACSAGTPPDAAAPTGSTSQSQSSASTAPAAGSAASDTAGSSAEASATDTVAASHLPPPPDGAAEAGKLFDYPSAYQASPVPYAEPTPLSAGSQASCDAINYKSGDPLKVIYIPPSSSYPYYHAIGLGLQKAIEAAGGTYSLQAPAQDQVSLQVPILRAAVEAKPTAIVMNTDSGQAVGPIVTQAEQAGIPVFVVNSDIPNFAVPIQGVIGYSQFQTDYIIGQYAIKLRAGQPTKVGVLAGAPDYFSEQRVGGFVAAAKTASNFDIVSTLNGNWNTADGQTATLNMLQAHPDIDLIFAANDYEILGAAQAAKSLGKNIILLGSDGDTNAGLEPVENGQITATMNTMPFVMGETAGQVVLDCLSHKFAGGWVQTPGVLTTKDNVLNFLCHPELLYPAASRTYECK